MCRHESFALQAAQDRVDRTAWESGRIEDVEAVPNAIGERMEDERRGIRQIHGRNSTYVEFRASSAPVGSAKQLDWLCWSGAWTACDNSELVSHIFVSWNRLDGWLRQIEGLRFVA